MVWWVTALADLQCPCHSRAGRSGFSTTLVGVLVFEHVFVYDRFLIGHGTPPVSSDAAGPHRAATPSRTRVAGR